MGVKTDNQRSEAAFVCLVLQTAEQELMSPVYTVKKSYGRNPFQCF